MQIWRCVLAGGVQRSSLSVKRTVPAFTGAEASATACLSHGRGVFFYRVGDYQIAPLPPQGGKGRCARWAQDIIACDAAERIIFAGVAGSGSGKLCWHSPFIRQRRRKAMPARIRGKSQLSIAREGFLDRRSKRCFWLLLSPQTKVARAGARNYPRRRQIMRLRRRAATPHPPPSGAPVSLRVGRFADLTRHRRVIQRREPLKGKADGGVSFNTANPPGGRLGLVRPGHPSPCDLIRGKADACGREGGRR